MFEDAWKKALKNTEIIRSRVKQLNSHSTTLVPYILLSESSINTGDTVVRKGEIRVEKPSLIVPPNNPQFSGFEFEEDLNENSLINYLLIRGISLPSMRYENQTASLDIFEGKLSAAVKSYQEELEMKENIQTGLLIGPEDYWQFSLLIFICSQIVRNADIDLKNLIDEHRRKNDS